MIGAVVVLYNPTVEEIKNINSYKNQVDYIVVVDNSAKCNRFLLEEYVGISQCIEYYSKNTNLGLAKGFNIGIDILIQKGCEWALLFDADSKLGSNIVEIYKKEIQKDHTNIAIYAPVHIFERSSNKPYIGYKELEWTMTSGCLYNCEIFKKQDGFFEELFVDGLDIDYCYKSKENEYRILECGEATIIHNPAQTKCFMGIKYGIASPYRYFMQSRQLIWCWKRYRRQKMFLIYLYKWFKVIVLFPNKYEYIKKMIEGSKAGYRLFNEWKRVK